MDITRRRLVSLTVTLTLLSLSAAAVLRPRSGPARASTYLFVDEFYSNQVSSDRAQPFGAAAAPSGSFDAGWPYADRFGNEVSAAVAAYKVDPIGTLYEEHSPQTELPRPVEPRS